MATIIAVQDAQTAGTITYWTLDGEVSIAALAQSWSARGLNPDNLPDESSDERCLALAIRSLATKRLLARPLGGDKGWALVEEKVEGDDLDYSTGLKARIGEAGLETFPPWHPMATQLRDAYDHQKTVHDSGTISSWLAHLARKHDAVGLRDTGGVYFVPRSRTEAWRKCADALEDISRTKIYEIPAMRSDEAVQAILDSVIREAEAEAADIESHVGDYGPRGLGNCERRCEEMLSKIAGYEDLLGKSLSTITAQIETLKGQLMAAKLAAQAEADAKKEAA